MESGSGYGSGFSKTALTIPKMAVFAPIPRTRMASADIANPGFLRRDRTASRNCCTAGIRHAACHGDRRKSWDLGGVVRPELSVIGTALFVSECGLQANGSSTHVRR